MSKIKIAGFLTNLETCKFQKFDSVTAAAAFIEVSSGALHQTNRKKSRNQVSGFVWTTTSPLTKNEISERLKKCNNQKVLLQKGGVFWSGTIEEFADEFNSGKRTSLSDQIAGKCKSTLGWKLYPL